MHNKYIAIEGNIGSGKTTLAEILAQKLNARIVLEEFADNTFLPRFYADPERYAFPLELSFLADRYKQLNEFVNAPELFSGPIITDYLLIKSKLFARVNLGPSEYDLFCRLFDVMDQQMRQPDLLLFLHAPVPVLQMRIHIRGREYEQSIEDEYLERIGTMYETFLATTKIPIVMIDTSIVDFSLHPAQLETLTNLLSGELEPRIYYLP